MTDTAAREEAVERVRAYVESWEGFEPSVTISDERDPNSLYLGDLRLLLSGGEGGSVAIASREGRAVIANLATEELLALVLDGDHRRGCQGREYTCSCGYDTRVEREATTLRSALTDPRQPSEAEPTEHKGRARTKGPKLMNRDRGAMLPCPFCQGAAEVVERENPMSKWRWSVDCTSSQCGMAGPVTANKSDAIAAWNVRALPVGGGVEEGMVLVPRNPTNAMLAAAFDLENRCAIHNYGGSPASDELWCVMLEAALSPRSADGQE